MDKVTIYNLALGRIGVQGAIVSEAEVSNEKTVCARFFDAALEDVLSMFPWQCARRFAVLAQLAENPHPEYACAYALPADCLAVAETFPARTKYQLSGRTLYTDKEGLKIGYTAKIDCSGLSRHVVSLVVIQLAKLIAPALSKGSLSSVGTLLQEFWNVEYTRARAQETRESFTHEEHIPWYVNRGAEV